MYREIDEGFDELERKQYEYELSGQWRWSVANTVSEMLSEQGIACDIFTVDDIEIMLGNTSEPPVSAIFEACSLNGEDIPNVLIERVSNELGYIRNTFRERARDKAQFGYELSRIWLYSDGSLENSPFDLMYDLEEIDRTIFSEDIEFEDIPTQQNSDDALDGFLRGDTNLALSIQQQEEELFSGTDSSSEQPTPTISGGQNISIPQIITWTEEHQYVCAPEDTSHGFGSWALSDVFSDLWRLQRYSSTSLSKNSNPSLLGQINAQSNSWNSSPIAPSTGTYSPVTDEFGCDGFFCITVETLNSNYGTTGSNPISLQSIFSKAAEHLEKPANASLTQRKMTTNNFEISSIIKNLPEMLRGFWIQVHIIPVPVLELEWDQNKENSPYWVLSMLEEYYKNNGLDYNRQNDLSLIENTALETKVFQTSAWMPVGYPEIRMNELRAFQKSMAENNRVFSKNLDKKILTDDLNGFDTHFSELERFVSSIEDFAVSVWSLIDAMKKIPTRSS